MASKGSFEEKSLVCWAKEKKRQRERRETDMRDGGRNDGRNGEGGKNIREYAGDDPSGTKRRGERKMEGGGENTHTKMSSSNPDLRRQGNRQWANFEPSPCGRTAKFLFELSSGGFFADGSR